MHIKTHVWFVIMFVFCMTCFQTVSASNIEFTSVYKESAEIGPFAIVVPTVMEVSIEYGRSGTNEYVVFEKETETFIPSNMYVMRGDRVYEENQSTQRLRFLAQPNTTYTLYRAPDRYVQIPYGPRGDLENDKGVRIVSDVLIWKPNSAFISADTDADTVSNIYDNCPEVENLNQKDIDSNGVGDACDDHDRDGVLNAYDNCPSLPNPQQLDIDNDNIGDECDGEESRLTERFTWVPWVGIGIAGIILCILFVIVARRPGLSPK